MVETAKYQDILAQVIREESKAQPKRGQVKIVPVCDYETQQYLLVALGWDKKRHISSIIFHARLTQGKIIIEEDNTEEGMAAVLRAAGVPDADILLGWRLKPQEMELLAA